MLYYHSDANRSRLHRRGYQHRVVKSFERYLFVLSITYISQTQYASLKEGYSCFYLGKSRLCNVYYVQKRKGNLLRKGSGHREGWVPEKDPKLSVFASVCVSADGSRKEDMMYECMCAKGELVSFVHTTFVIQRRSSCCYICSINFDF
jgi:hypothetical protein